MKGRDRISSQCIISGNITNTWKRREMHTKISPEKTKCKGNLVESNGRIL